MRKITSKQQEDRKKKRNQWVVGVVLIFIMFFSVLGFSFKSEEHNNNKKIIYNGFEFVEQNNFWILNIEGIIFVFKNNPNEVEKIHSELNSIEKYSGEPLYVYSESTEAELEIDINLRQIVLRKQNACINEEDCIGNFPIKTCEDNFIIIKEDNETMVTQEGNCVFIQGPQENLTKITDSFLLRILGVN